MRVSHSLRLPLTILIVTLTVLLAIGMVVNVDVVLDRHVSNAETHAILRIVVGWLVAIGLTLLTATLIASWSRLADRAELERRASEQQFLQLAERVEAILWIRAPDSRQFEYVNPHAEKIFGISRHDLLVGTGRWLDAIHPDDRARVIASWESGDWDAFHERYRIVRADGSVRWVDDQAYAVHDGRGRVQRICGLATDVTDQIEDQRILESQVAARTEELRALLDGARDLASTLEFDHLMARIIDRLKALVDYSGMGLVLKNGEEWIAEAARLPTGARSSHPLHMNLSNPILRTIIDTQLPLVFHDLTTDPQMRAAVLDIPDNAPPGMFEYIACWMGVPLIVDDVVIGVLFVDHHEPNWFTAEREQLVRAFANQIALAIKNVRLYHDVRMRLLEVESLQRVTTALLETHTLERVLEIVCGEACALVRSRAGAILSYDGSALVVAHQRGTIDLSSAPFVDFVSRIIECGEKYSCNDPGQIAGLVRLPDVPLTSLMVIPLWLQDQPLGALCAANKEDGFSEQDVRTLGLLADAAVMALNGANLSLQAQELAVMQERQRLALELHDSVTQALYSARLYADAVEMGLASEKVAVAKGNLQKLKDSVEEAMNAMRRLVFELRPPSLDDGLFAAIELRMASVESRIGLKTELLVQNEQRMPARVETEVYWIAMEALNNVIKHAQANRVSANLRFRDRSFTLEISDDGIGITPEVLSAGVGSGLPGMRERASGIGADLIIERGSSGGTLVQLVLPYSA